MMQEFPTVGTHSSDHTALVPNEASLSRPSILDAFAAFLRLNVAQGDASPQTIRSCHAHVGQFVEWCDEEGIDRT